MQQKLLDYIDKARDKVAMVQCSISCLRRISNPVNVDALTRSIAHQVQEYATMAAKKTTAKADTSKPKTTVKTRTAPGTKAAKKTVKPKAAAEAKTEIKAKAKPVKAKAAPKTKAEPKKKAAAKTKAAKTKAAPKKKVAAKKAAPAKAKTVAKTKAPAKTKKAAEPKVTAKTKKAPSHVGTASEELNFGPTGFFTTTDLSKEFETMTQDSMKMIEEMSTQSKAGVDAVLESSAIFAKGCEEVAKSVMAFTQSSMEEQVKVGQTLLGAKTLREFTELQSEVAKQTVDRVVGEVTKISELSMKTANDAAQPITDQVNAAVKSLSEAS